MLRSRAAPPLFEAVKEECATLAAAGFSLFRSPKSLIRSLVVPSFSIGCSLVGTGGVPSQS